MRNKRDKNKPWTREEYIKTTPEPCVMVEVDGRQAFGWVIPKYELAGLPSTELKLKDFCVLKFTVNGETDSVQVHWDKILDHLNKGTGIYP